VVDRDVPERRQRDAGNSGCVRPTAIACAARRTRNVKTADSTTEVNTGTASLRTAVLVANSPSDASNVIIEHCSPDADGDAESDCTGALARPRHYAFATFALHHGERELSARVAKLENVTIPVRSGACTR
jgi:hypothetical protein